MWGSVRIDGMTANQTFPRLGLIFDSTYETTFPLGLFPYVREFTLTFRT